ncbi:YraN family protein [Nocardia sp. NPDC050712]|uniref:YraN family protein n=1 Tax=Nocardia sp. NPDC050712 TaxID=3155518 RepID=UPI0033F9D21A
MTDKKALGARGEELAARYLRSAGWQIIGRNWRCRYGELDLIARASGITAFIEVKTRRGLGFGTPAESVTYQKRRRIRTLALLWLNEHDSPCRTVRFDVISVLLLPGQRPVIDHLESAF